MFSSLQTFNQQGTLFTNLYNPFNNIFIINQFKCYYPTNPDFVAGFVISFTNTIMKNC